MKYVFSRNLIDQREHAPFYGDKSACAPQNDSRKIAMKEKYIYDNYFFSFFCEKLILSPRLSAIPCFVKNLN